MKIVRTFATSANIGSGFDCLGICFDIYNEYAFEESNQYQLVGFEEEFQNPNNNLIIKSYEKVFEHLNHKIKYIKLKVITQNIPISRGMGSSASCIVTGVLIANEVLNNPLTKDEIFNLATKLEGHPDNVAPLIYGGLVSSYKADLYYPIKYQISNKLNFILFVPPFKLSTEDARRALPKQVSIKDATNNIANCLATIKGLEDGNIDLLIKSNNDLLHEPYRLPLIKDSSLIKQLAKENNASCYISGAGPTLLIICQNDLEITLPTWKKLIVNPNQKGAYIYEKE